jgi:hypothetical protein
MSEQNSLTILGRIHRHVLSRYVDSYHASEMKKTAVLGVYKDRFGVEMRQMCALTVETKDEVHRFIRRWNALPNTEKQLWKDVADGRIQ